MNVKKSKTKSGFLLILFTTLFIAGGQLLFNLASKTFEFSINGIFFNYFMWAGFIAYAGGLLTLIFGLKEGELTILYPLLSLSYIWVLIFSVIFFDNTLTILKTAGTLSIVVGIIIITKKTSNDESKTKKFSKRGLKNG